MPRPTGSSRRARPAEPVAAGAAGSTSSCAAQRAARLAIVEDALRRTGGLHDAVVEPGGGVDPDGYRTTIRVAPTADGRAGYHAEASHDVVAAPECLIAHPTLRELLPALRSGGRGRADAAGVRGHGRARRPMGRRQGHGARAAGGHAARRGCRAPRGRRRASPAGVDGVVLPVRSAGRGPARRHRPPRRARAVGGRGRRRRVRRCRDVQRLRHRSVEPRRSPSRPRGRPSPMPPTTSSGARPRSCGARSGAGGRRRGWTWTS